MATEVATNPNKRGRRDSSAVTSGTAQGDSHNNVVDQNPSRRQIIVFIVKLGTNLPRSRINMLSKRAQELGATVLPHFQATREKRKRRRFWKLLEHSPQKPEPKIIIPTHIVIDEDCNAEEVAETLKFASTEDFEMFLQRNGVQCAIPRWIVRCAGDHLKERLRRDEQWWKIGSKKQSNGDSSQSPSKWLCIQYDDDEEDEADRRSNNERLAEAFQELGKLHQKCAFSRKDEWKAYTFNKAAGRIRYLDFEVTNDKECLDRIGGIHGIGDGTVEKIEEFLNKGYIERTINFKKDESRIAMKALQAIWGVGRTKALDLINQGYTSIEAVRKGLNENKIHLDRNQGIGVDCYEDIQEDMSREEVEEIRRIVRDAICQEFPPEDKEKLEVTLMGSYRRKKEACGDADILITHRDYTDTVPPQILGEVVEKLLESHRLAFHLTFISGMKARTGAEHLEGGYNAISDNSTKLKPDRESGSSYMGVMYSPTIAGKRRRVDIKFYPYRERAFAQLYFTGNGFFNRSMRLWVQVKKQLQLNDHGLFERDTKKRVMKATEEKDVFDFLGLQYKEPEERDCFDAVIEGEIDVSESDFLRFEGDHKWID